MKAKRPWAIMNWLEKTIFVLGTLSFASIVVWLFVMILAFFFGFWGALFGVL